MNAILESSDLLQCRHTNTGGRCCYDWPIWRQACCGHHQWRRLWFHVSWWARLPSYCRLRIHNLRTDAALFYSLMYSNQVVPRPSNTPKKKLTLPEVCYLNLARLFLLELDFLVLSLTPALKLFLFLTLSWPRMWAQFGCHSVSISLNGAVMFESVLLASSL